MQTSCWTKHLHLCLDVSHEAETAIERLTANMLGWHSKLEHDRRWKQFRSDEKIAISSGMQQFDGANMYLRLIAQALFSINTASGNESRSNSLNYLHILTARKHWAKGRRGADLFATRGIHQTETEFGVNKTAHAWAGKSNDFLSHPIAFDSPTIPYFKQIS